SQPLALLGREIRGRLRIMHRMALYALGRAVPRTVEPRRQSSGVPLFWQGMQLFSEIGAWALQIMAWCISVADGAWKAPECLLPALLPAWVKPRRKPERWNRF